MKLQHKSKEGEKISLATDVEIANTFLKKAIGLMGKKDLPEGYALMFRFNKTKPRTIHMIGVRTALDVLWVEDGTVNAVKTLPPWTGIGREAADMVIELPPQTATAVMPGDQITVEE
ncbi:DUF192 domain-containing protein [Salinarchaeum sp. IM2453]|uniref:DUF192 domain-containing protein n=1 Tax=Salinarchaeum sp. IM2453 TaxID=2862870 RepID=UPI001C82FA50|nr:DUF192 domain-containing protein [Salinarchaeum sp. IM2453]QZA87486.1 DUF192 domain-containing protein [Salinarchaeum sp. IM2453]